MGRPRPDHLPQDTSFVRNEVGQNNEVLVDWRRRFPGSEVLEEFIQVTGERMQFLNALTPRDFDQAMDTPIGPGTMRDFLSIRIFDAWVHEQDMRRALAAPGHMEGAGGPAQSGPNVHGPALCHRQEGWGSGWRHRSVPHLRPRGENRLHRRGRPACQGNRTPANPSVVLTLDVETFTCLCCGRRSSEQVVEAGKVGLEGDKVLGRTIVANMNFMI